MTEKTKEIFQGEAASIQAGEDDSKQDSLLDDYVRELVYGGLDGIITTFAVVSGVTGAALGTRVILIMGFANLLADGLSMAVGAYLSCRSEQSYYRSEREAKREQVQEDPEEEVANLYETYLDQGYTEGEAAKLVDVQTNRKKTWIRELMIHERHMQLDHEHPVGGAIATFLAFLVAGAVPLVAYIIGPGDGSTLGGLPVSSTYLMAGIATAVSLFGLGAARTVVTGRHWARSGGEMLMVGGLAGAVAAGVGYFLRGLGGNGG